MSQSPSERLLETGPSWHTVCVARRKRNGLRPNISLGDIIHSVSRLLLTRGFDRWRRKAKVADAVLRRAVAEMRRGLVDADLGGGLFKKRIPLPGRGKRGGARTLLATNRGGRWIFLTGYAKNEIADLSPRETDAFRELAKDMLKLAEHDLDRLLALGEFTEIPDENEN